MLTPKQAGNATCHNQRNKVPSAGFSQLLSNWMLSDPNALLVLDNVAFSVLLSRGSSVAYSWHTGSCTPKQCHYSDGVIKEDFRFYVHNSLLCGEVVTFFCRLSSLVQGLRECDSRLLITIPPKDKGLASEVDNVLCVESTYSWGFLLYLLCLRLCLVWMLLLDKGVSQMNKRDVNLT